MTTKYEGLVTCVHRKVDDGGRILCGLIKGRDREVSIDLCRACPVPQINCQHLRAAMQKKVSTPITVRFATGRVEVWDNEAPTIGFKQAACAVKAMPIHSARDCTGCPLRMAHVVPQTPTQAARRTKSAESGSSQPAAPAPPMIDQAAVALAVPSVIQVSDPVEIKLPQTARDIVERAQSLAAKNAHGRTERAAALPLSAAETNGPSEATPKIILFQTWLAEQFKRKKAESTGAAPQPDQDGVQDILYSPVAATHEEEPGYERCVGWTD